MQCEKPLHAFYTGLKTSKGRDLIIVKPNSVLSVGVRELLKKGDEYKPFVERVLGMKYVPTSFVRNTAFYKYKEIPCGHCLACFLAKSREWAMRCLFEYETCGSKGMFLTLTYDQDHIPFKAFFGSFKPKAREVLAPVVCSGNKWSFLVKKDLQDFNKRLRRWCDYHGYPSWRFYGCGEYGSSSGRAHFHECLFGFDWSELPDLVPWHEKGSDETYWTSLSLDKVWGKGRVVVGKVTFETCAYVARYVIKKQGKVDGYRVVNPWSSDYPEFVLMSRRPGLGRAWLESHVKQRLFDEIHLNRSSGVVSCKPPRYSDYLFREYEPEKFLAVQQKRLGKIDSCGFPVSSFLGSSDDVVALNEYFEISCKEKFCNKVLQKKMLHKKNNVL